MIIDLANQISVMQTARMIFDFEPRYESLTFDPLLKFNVTIKQQCIHSFVIMRLKIGEI